MTKELGTLEQTLAQLANDFARDLVSAVLLARVSEVRAALDRPTLTFPAPGPAAAPPAPRAPRAAASPRSSRAPVRVVAPAARTSGSASRGTRSQPQRERDAVDEPDDTSPSNVITDPGLLLDVIASGPRSTRLPRALPEVLSPRAPESAASPAASGPALRPGERLQRTAGGNVVLRRGRS